jgi:Protein of unknown function (DUF3099)
MSRTGPSRTHVAGPHSSGTGGNAAARDGSVRITWAQTSHSERVRGRQRRYLFSMGIRTVCFVLAVATDGTLRWVFIVAAVVLPYVAVVMANAGGEVDRDAPEPFVDDRRRMLDPGPSAADEPPANGSTHPGQ